MKVILLLFKKNIFYKFRYDTFGTSKILFIFLYLLGQNRIFHWKSPKSPHYFEIRQYRQFLGLKIAEIRHLAIYRQPKISIATERPKIADLAIYRQIWQHCVSLVCKGFSTSWDSLRVPTEFDQNKDRFRDEKLKMFRRKSLKKMEFSIENFHYFLMSSQFELLDQIFAFTIQKRYPEQVVQ